MRAGSVSVVPAGASSSFECDQENDVTLVSVSPDLINKVASELRMNCRAGQYLPVIFNSRNDTIESLSKIWFHSCSSGGIQRKG